MCYRSQTILFIYRGFITLSGTIGLIYWEYLAIYDTTDIAQSKQYLWNVFICRSWSLARSEVKGVGGLFKPLWWFWCMRKKTNVQPKEGNILFMVIWHQTYGKGPLSQWERKPAAITRLLLYASSHRQNNIYHGLCYSSHIALAGMRNSSMGPSWRTDLMIHHTMSE